MRSRKRQFRTGRAIDASCVSACTDAHREFFPRCAFLFFGFRAGNGFFPLRSRKQRPDLKKTHLHRNIVAGRTVSGGFLRTIGGRKVFLRSCRGQRPVKRKQTGSLADEMQALGAGQRPVKRKQTGSRMRGTNASPGGRAFFKTGAFFSEKKASFFFQDEPAAPEYCRILSLKTGL